jgi:hypothetical protein
VGEDEPYVSVGQKPVLISAVCLHMESFSGKLPDDLFQILSGCMHEQPRILKMKLVQDPSYETAAQCLFQLIEEKRAKYRNRS